MRRSMPLLVALILVALAALAAPAGVAATLHLPGVIGRPPAQPSPSVTATATNIPAPATNTPTVTPTVEPSPTEHCYAQMLDNSSFETGLDPWVIEDDPFGDLSPVTTMAADGTYSLQIGGRLNAYQELVQDTGPVPQWAESGAAYFSWFMETEEASTNHGNDCLFMVVYQAHPGGSFQRVAGESFCSNDMEGVWTTARFELPASALRGLNLRVELHSMGNHARPTTWHVDDVRVVFTCGGRTP